MCIEAKSLLLHCNLQRYALIASAINPGSYMRILLRLLLL